MTIYGFEQPVMADVLTAPVIYLSYYLLLMSLVTFIVYGYDKYQARTGGWRTNEMSLQLLALLGGWPGALLAMRVFRHKYRKRRFVFTLYFICGVNVLAIMMLLAALDVFSLNTL